MEFLRTIKESETKREDWTDAFYWLVCTIIGNMPIWLLLIPLIRLSQTANINMLESGEFALYSWSVLFGALYVVNREVIPFGGRKRKSLIARFIIPFPNRRLLFHAILLLALVCFVVLVTTSLQDLTQRFIILDKHSVSWVTAVVFLISLTLSFLITVVDNASVKRRFERMDVEAVQKELEEYKQEGLESLEEEFDKLDEVD
jgi:hypothetical protein